jgi:SAM-dependent methyltransferase
VRARIKRFLKTHRQSDQPFIRILAGGLLQLLRAANRRWQGDPTARAASWLDPSSSDRVHQTNDQTKFDRYPELFAEIRDFVGAGAAVRILSFGCSSGEEVLTLRRYFPSAVIVGAEINPDSLAACRRLSVDGQIEFIESTYDNVSRSGPYDLIFCLAVLQRTPRKVIEGEVRNLSAIYPFERFDRQLTEFDSYLKAEGILVLQYTHYLFHDATVAPGYRAVTTQVLRSEVRFDRNGDRLADHIVVPNVFQKLPMRSQFVASQCR